MSICFWDTRHYFPHKPPMLVSWISLLSAGFQHMQGWASLIDLIDCMCCALRLRVLSALSSPVNDKCDIYIYDTCMWWLNKWCDMCRARSCFVMRYYDIYIEIHTFVMYGRCVMYLLSCQSCQSCHVLWSGRCRCRCRAGSEAPPSARSPRTGAGSTGSAGERRERERSGNVTRCNEM